MPPAPESSISRHIEVRAPADRVWELVSDLPRMGEFSPENTGGRWVRGATGPTLGARFAGSNRRGWRRWSTSVKVVGCEPGRRFAFDVSIVGLSVATWTYDVQPAGSHSCLLTETWTDGRSGPMKLLGLLATGVRDRAALAEAGIQTTLDRVKAHAEAG